MLAGQADVVLVGLFRSVNYLVVQVGDHSDMVAQEADFEQEGE